MYTPNSAGQPWSITSPVVERFELRPGDHWAPDALTSERAELVSSDCQPFDVDVWLSMGLKVTAPDITSKWMVAGQFRAHDESGDYTGRSPVFAQELYHGVFQVVTRSYPQSPATQNASSVVRYRTVLRLGVWMQIVYKLRFSRADVGSLAMWMDGEQAVPETPIPMGSNDKLGPQWKYGAYRAAGSSLPVIVEYSNLEVGTADLTGRIAQPLPV